MSGGRALAIGVLLVKDHRKEEATCVLQAWMLDSKIEAEVKLTGILSLGALMPGEQGKYGTTISPSLYAPVHQHFFVARMDTAVDFKPNEAYNQVRNTRTVNRTGQPTGFSLVPGSNCLPFALPEAKFLRRAGFLKA
ncbi:hypothetical protein ABZP36_022770 [Zizania latifolia]